MKRATILSIALVAGCSATLTPQILAPLGPDPVLSGGTYSSGGGITVATDLRERDGRTMVCGAWAQSRQQSVLTKGVEHRVLGSGSVALDGQALVRGLLFMRETEPLESYAGAEAGCIVTDRPWRPGDEARRPTIAIPGQVVYRDSDEGGSIIVNFRQTGSGAGT